MADVNNNNSNTQQGQPTYSSLYQHKVTDIDGNEVSLSKYQGQVSLVVNVASACGLTRRSYQQLQTLYDKYRDQGFQVLAFPCNQFRNQESGDEQDIKTFAREEMKVTFPLFAKIDVNGPNTHPVYQFLKRSYRDFAGGGLFTTDKILWNFGKFLVNRQGICVNKYAPTTDPLSIEKDIVEELKKKS